MAVRPTGMVLQYHCDKRGSSSPLSRFLLLLLHLLLPPILSLSAFLPAPTVHLLHTSMSFLHTASISSSSSISSTSPPLALHLLYIVHLLILPYLLYLQLHLLLLFHPFHLHALLLNSLLLVSAGSGRFPTFSLLSFIWNFCIRSFSCLLR